MRIGIYIGTSARDFKQYKALVNSIKAYNMDNLPVFTSVRDEDFNLFKSEFEDENITFLKDSDVYQTQTTDPWYRQQMIKMNFWRLDLLDVMIQIDSDSFFIKNFYKSDFMATDTDPYTVLHENKELREFFAKNNLFNSRQEDNGDFSIEQGFASNSSKIRDVFGTNTIKAEYDYGHPPCIWSNEVWKKLYTNYVEPNKLTYEQLLDYANSEQQWYGETLLAFKVFPVYPKENMFKTFHYPNNYLEFLNSDQFTNLKYNYHGICLQSNWSANTAQSDDLYSRFFTKSLDPKMHNGQFGEDTWLLDNLNIPKNGVVVDVGADQPIFGSNTYYFEKYLGWNSLCIDADERVLSKLKAKRKKVIHCAVSDSDGTITFNQHHLAGISRVSDEGSVTVPCKTLNTIFEENDITEVTLLDIDVEGHELQVCRGLDWKKYQPKIVIIEFLSPEGGNIEKELVQYFKSLGSYRLVHKTFANLIFIHETF